MGYPVDIDVHDSFASVYLEIYFDLFCIAFRSGVGRPPMYGGPRLGGGPMSGPGPDGYLPDHFAMQPHPGGFTEPQR